MKKIQLGKSSLEVSVLGLGGINFGTKTKEDDAFALLDTYYSMGGNFIDTSNNYAVWNGGDGGESERVIGKWLQKRRVRKNIIVATKLGALPKDATFGFDNMQGLSKEVIISAVQKSLENLQSDYIDLLYLHVDDFSTPQLEVMSTLNELIQKGIIREIACSNFYTWRIESARKICEDNNYRFFCAVQQRYSYLAPTMDADLFPQVAVNRDMISYLKYYNDLTLVAYSPLLKGQYNRDDIEKEEYQTNSNKRKLEDLRKQSSNPNAWVMNYIINSFTNSVALLTTSNVEHLKQMIEAI
ncbi:MAG: aldo/keto reductase [Coprobacillaceae bacterium]